MKSRFLAAIAASALISGAFIQDASAATIGFDGLESGPLQSVPLLSFSESGFSFDLISNGPNAGAAIFNVNDPAAQAADPDLVPLSGNGTILDNILILQGDGPFDPTTPDDDANGGSIDFLITGLPGGQFSFGGVSVVDDGDFSVFVDGDQVAAADLSEENDTAFLGFTPVDVGIGTLITLDFGSQSGGFDTLVFNRVAAVPLPAALPMMLGGLALFGFLGFRRRAAQGA